MASVWEGFFWKNFQVFEKLKRFGQKNPILYSNIVIKRIQTTQFGDFVFPPLCDFGSSLKSFRYVGTELFFCKKKVFMKYSITLQSDFVIHFGLSVMQNIMYNPWEFKTL